jgi:hypothetical protein
MFSRDDDEEEEDERFKCRFRKARSGNPDTHKAKIKDDARTIRIKNKFDCVIVNFWNHKFAEAQRKKKIVLIK